MTALNNGHKRVAIVGTGIVSPLGFGLDETLVSLQQARDCVAPVTVFSVENTRCKTAAQIDDERLIPKRLNRRERRLHRASHMLITALEELLQEIPSFQPQLAVVGTTSGGMSFGEQFYRLLGKADCLAALAANYPPQKQIGDALEKFNIGAPTQIVANACASGTNALGHAFTAIRSGRYQRILTGGYDALSELVFVGFDSLQAATPEKCRPFDANRSGMVLGEGAALFALQEFDSAQASNLPILGEIVGYGITTDNFHLTQPEPSGSAARFAMEQALAEVPVKRVDYINAHGTATVFNDAAEGKAIADLFDGVAVSSTKSMMGHSLGAAGAIEAVVTLLALQHQFLPPNINFTRLDPTLTLDIVANEPRTARVDYALSNSFGFGGTNASILLRKAE